MQRGEGFLHRSLEYAEEYLVSFFMMCAVCCAHSLADSPKGINGEMLGPEVGGCKFKKHWDLRRIHISFFLYLLF